MDHQDRDQEQALAATLAALLLVGVTLIARELIGLWPAAALGMGAVLVAYWGPAVARRIAIAREVRQFGRRVAAWERATR